MNLLSKLPSFIVIVGLMQAQDSPGSERESWNRIRSFLEQDTGSANPEFLSYLKSLTAEEMLTAARQSCEDAATQPGNIHEEMRAGAAGIYVIVCLEYYLDKCTMEEGGGKLLEIAADTEEHPWFRRAIIARTSGSPDTRFAKKFQVYIEAHRGPVDTLLGRVAGDPGENALLREAAISALGERVRAEGAKIAREDANVHAVWERMHKVVPVGEMVRSGELTLAKETWDALVPLEARILANTKMLAGIRANEEEPETVRARAKSVLRSYLRLPLTAKGFAEVEKALRIGTDQRGEQSPNAADAQGE